MTISEAIPYLLKNHYIRRKSWMPECDITLFGGVWCPNGFHNLFEEDLMADDWEAVTWEKQQND